MALKMIKVDLKCKTCKWKDKMFLAEGTPLNALQCPTGAGHFGLELLRSYKKDKENYEVKVNGK